MPDTRKQKNFNPHSPCGERRRPNVYIDPNKRISIHTPHAGSDKQKSLPPPNLEISIHTPHAWNMPGVREDKFQSTLPMRGATSKSRFNHSPRRISIHTPHAGSDYNIVLMGKTERHFNPHSPCGERHAWNMPGVREDKFQSTLPMRGATLKLFANRQGFTISIHTPHAGSDPTCLWLACTYPPYFNPHSPCGERPYRSEDTGELVRISIHTPHAGSDGDTGCLCVIVYEFQSTLPMRGATGRWIHGNKDKQNFNPHSPCGERQMITVLKKYGYLFQSTLPMRGATYNCRMPLCFRKFQSTLPMRGATLARILKSQPLLISIHTPHAGSDLTKHQKFLSFFQFQSTLPMRGATRY